MKVAFLFEETYPNYDLAIRVIQAIPVEEREAMDSLISTGLWGINESAASLGLRNVEHIEALIAQIVHNQEGSLTRVVSDESIAEMARGNIFAVIFDSIDRSLTVRLHDLLKKVEPYRGLVQVLPHLPRHRQVFGGCPPSLRLEAKTLFVWSPEDPGQFDDEEEPGVPDEIVQWVKEEYPLLGLSVQKKAVGFKGTIFDRDSDETFVIQQGVQELVEEWTGIAEHVIYKLSDFAPDVVHELNSALKRLNRPKLSAAECGQVAVSLRRSLELLAQLLNSGSPEKMAETRTMPGMQPDRYMDLIRRYLAKHFSENQQVREDITFQMQDLNRLLNKGVHEHWTTSLIRPLAIRTILLMNSLLFPVKAGVVQWRVGDDLFD